MDRQLARANGDPCANLCTAATVDGDNQPHARTLVLRDLGPRMALFLNQTSPKWQQISERGEVCVVVWLPSLSLQYRLQCHVEPIAKSLVDESWLLRPDTPKRLDWYYTTHQPQSSTVDSREVLLTPVLCRPTEPGPPERSPRTQCFPLQRWHLAGIRAGALNEPVNQAPQLRYPPDHESRCAWPHRRTPA
jgi:hypothetical protein